MSERLEGKVVIITGATSGIGYRTAEIFVKEGALVLLAARREVEGAALADRLGANAQFVKTDVTREDNIKAMVESALNRWGRIDCLFNNASAGTPSGPVDQLSYEDFRGAMDLQAGSVFLGIKHVVPVMKKQGGGSIINNASVAGVGVGFGPTLYSAGKAAVIQMTRCLAIDLGEFNVRLNCISPGGVMTPIFLGSKGKEMSGDEADRAIERLSQVYVDHSPLKRAGTPDDIAYAAVYFASDESRHVTGENLIVDSGISVGRSREDQARWAAWRNEAMFGA